MAKNQNLARSIADAGWRLLRTPWRPGPGWGGPTVRVVPRWQPTSRIGSECGSRVGELRLSARQWLRPDCRTEHHRDVNVYRPSLATAPVVKVNACGSESRSGWPASGCEAGAHLNDRYRDGLLERRNPRPEGRRGRRQHLTHQQRSWAPPGEAPPAPSITWMPQEQADHRGAGGSPPGSDPTSPCVAARDPGAAAERAAITRSANSRLAAPLG